MKRTLLIVAVLFLGCGDPAKDRLPEGVEVIVFDEMSNTTALYETAGTGAKAETIEVGSKCRVVSDKEEDGPLSRFVRVKALDGKNRDKVGYVLRSELRPIAK